MPEVDTPPEYRERLARQGFVLGAVLGQGLSGSVYVAEQRSLGRDVAVKFFDSAFVRADASMRKRFFREARLLARFQHPGIPYILTEGMVAAVHGETPYFVMEFIDGKTLANKLREDGPIDVEKAIVYARQVLDALGYAHERRIVHRDVKSANIMVNERGRCFLIDFSIGVSLLEAPGLTRSTMTGAQLGSDAYVAPEQRVSARDVDHRADIYSMGVVLIEMLTGRTDRTNIPRALANVPHRVVQAIERACALTPDARVQSADEFLRALGGATGAMPPGLQPGLAICANTACADANWSPNGYYRGPRFIEDATQSYCTTCGHPLTYGCGTCGASVTRTPHCGACGGTLFHVPECKSCGSFLTREYLGKDTTKGCGKCLRRQEALSPKAPSDDDIPF